MPITKFNKESDDRRKIIDEIVSELMADVKQLAAEDGVDENALSHSLWATLGRRLLFAGVRGELLIADIRDLQCDLGEPAPRHSVTYMNYFGGPAVRVLGPQAHHAMGHEVEVTLPDGTTQRETLTECIWRGLDLKDFEGRPASGQPLALYRFADKPRSGFQQ